MNSAANGDGELDEKPINMEEDERREEAGAAGRVSETDGAAGASGTEDSARVLEGEGSELRVRGGVDSEMVQESRVLEVKNERNEGLNDDSGAPDDSEVDDEEEEEEEEDQQTENSSAGEGKGEVYTSLLSEFEAFVANEKNGAMLGTSRALSFGFDVGDMVWGKVKSHPWWPGHIFNEAFATSSVRRTRREGHVLVAFFGDSSYGWFDPAELIPFEPHLAEKSQQTSSRTFTKAVEEAVDEASRRCGLALVCRCRNKCNFRSTNISGYFEVDVPDYEANAVYSAAQIQKARDGFKPSVTLAFLKRLARDPVGGDPLSIDYIGNKATAVSLRRTLFEEFDETYGQAFGAPHARGSDEARKVLDHPVKGRTRAPLSGPLVIAEALSGGNKSSKKHMKVKDHSKKDKYLFKRRDEPSESRTHPIGQMEATPSVPAAYVEGTSVVEASDFVLQKRAPPQSSSAPELEAQVNTSNENRLASEDASVKEAAMSDHVSENLDAQATAGLPGSHGSSSSSQQVAEAVMEIKYEETTKALGPTDSAQDSPGEVKPPVGASIEGKVKKKKAKILKRPLPDGSSEETIMVVKKKKKKDTGSETATEPLKKAFSNEKKMKKPTGKKSGLISLPPKDDSRVNNPNEVELPQLLKGLHTLAINPFHGAQITRSAAALQFFLRFRSLVYQKSLAVSPPQSETEPSVEAPPRASKSVGTTSADGSSQQRVKLRPEDPAKSGRKRLPSDRQEEMAAKKSQKVGQIKSMAAAAAEKKTGGGGGQQRSWESQRPPPEGKSAKATAPVVEPTMLVMKFPPRTNLPSVAELKARFARFGSIDPSAIRVFWKSSTCRVVFRYRQDAEAALKYANRNSYLFGNVDVKYSLRDVLGAEGGGPESEKDVVVERQPLYQPVLRQSNVQLKSILKKSNGDEPAGGGQGNAGGGGNGNGGRGTPRVKFMLGGEDNIGGRSEPQPAAVMGGGSSSRNNFNNSNHAINTTTSVAMDVNSKSFHQKAILPLPPSTSPPLLPLPPQFAKDPSIISTSSGNSTSSSNLQESEAVVVDRNLHRQNANNAPPSGPVEAVGLRPPPRRQGVDISQQMLSLLERCNEVVVGVTGVLGYVPYHPL
ncbi:unnamed protein product [Linum tenue]|uniref:PWWP domain-containing protein n=1 Tax=Linum tenue TaxID=586396 RepID=A0AAV0NP05_9ROSI|nr:unnamed protein product [Linum tenue]